MATMRKIVASIIQTFFEFNVLIECIFIEETYVYTTILQYNKVIDI